MSGWGSFGRRVLGALRLRGDTYRELAHSPAALTQAVAVILLASLASGLVYLIDDSASSLGVDVDWENDSLVGDSRAVAALFGTVLDAGWGIFVWAAQSAIVLLIWNRFSSRPRVWRSIAVPLGFANAPLIIFAFLELLPVVGGSIAVVGLSWTAIASILALRTALDTGWIRATILLVVTSLLFLPVSMVLSRL
jgi:hypothetical protein